jgi:hypothetical protein
MGVAPSQSTRPCSEPTKDALEKLDPNQVYHTFPDRREGSKSSLILLPDGLPIAPELLTKWYRQ